MPSADLIREFIDDTKQRFEKLETKMDRQFMVGVLVIAILAGPKGIELAVKAFEIAVTFAGAK